MTNFNEGDHPRANDGQFSAKQQTPPSSGLLSYIAGKGPTDDGPWDLSEGDMLIYSHADGDFDAAELGIEGIEVWRDDNGYLRAAAYTDLDFNHLPPTDIPFPEREAWLDEHAAVIKLAVSELYPTVRLDPANGSWDNQKIVIDLPAEQESFPGDCDAVVSLAETNEQLSTFVADLPAGSAQPFWTKVRQAVEIAEDHEQELAGIRELGRQGRI